MLRLLSTLMRSKLLRIWLRWRHQKMWKTVDLKSQVARLKITTSKGQVSVEMKHQLVSWTIQSRLKLSISCQMRTT